MENKTPEDVDVLTLVGAVKKGVISLFALVIGIIDFSIKKIIPLSIFVFVALAIVAGLYFINKPYYTSHLSISHKRCSNDFCKTLIEDLNTGINSKDKNLELSKTLSINPEIAQKVKSFAYYPLNTKAAKVYEDSSSTMLPFQVEVEVFDNEILPTLQKSIMNYLESNEYATIRKEADKQELVRIQERLSSEIRELDSIKQLVNSGIVPRSTGQGIILGEPIHPVHIHQTIVSLYEKQMAAMKKASLNESFEVVSNFSKNRTRGGGGAVEMALIGALIGYLIGFFYLLRKAQFKLK